MSISKELYIAARSATLCTLPAIPAAYGVMKVGQVARLVLFDNLKFENCTNMDFARAAVIWGTSAGLIYYWPVILEIPKKLSLLPKDPKKHEISDKNHPVYKVFETLCRSISAAAVVGTGILCVRIKNPRDQMLVCGGFLAIQGMIYYIKPSKKKEATTDVQPGAAGSKPAAAKTKPAAAVAIQGSEQ